MKISGLLLALVATIPCGAKDYFLHSFKKLKLDKEFYSEGANFGDFNRDGRMDVVSGPFWYEGPQFEKRHQFYDEKSYDPKGYSKNFFAFSYDFNNDAWPDILIVGFPGEETWWFENPKGKDQRWERFVAWDVTDNESPHFGDITGDGKPELICTSTIREPNGTNSFIGYAEPDWKNPKAKWQFHRISTPGKWQRFTHGFGYGDVNGDGRLDILEKDGWWEQPKSLRSDGPWKMHRFSFGTGGAQMYAYDVDGDKDNDIITSIAAHGYGLAWFEQVQEKEEITFRQHLIMNKEPHENRYGIKFSQLHAVDLFDMDGDGLRDIITGKRYWAHGPTGDAEPTAPAVLYWFKLVRNGKKGVDFIPYLIDNDSGVGTQVVVGNLNGDRFPDVVVGNKQGTFVLLQERKKVKRKTWEAAQPKPFQATPTPAP